MCEILSSANVGPLIRLHGKIGAAMYKNIIEHVFFSLRASPVSRFFIIQDNDPCHYCQRTVRHFFDAENVEVWSA